MERTASVVGVAVADDPAQVGRPAAEVAEEVRFGDLGDLRAWRAWSISMRSSRTCSRRRASRARTSRAMLSNRRASTPSASSRAATEREVAEIGLARLQRRRGARHPRDLLEVLELEVAQPLRRQRRIEARLQDGRLERLGQVVGRAHLDAADDARDVVHAGDDDDREVAQRRVGLDRLRGSRSRP